MIRDVGKSHLGAQWTRARAPCHLGGREGQSAAAGRRTRACDPSTTDARGGDSRTRPGPRALAHSADALPPPPGLWKLLGFPLTSHGAGGGGTPGPHPARWEVLQMWAAAPSHDVTSPAVSRSLLGLTAWPGTMRLVLKPNFKPSFPRDKGHLMVMLLVLLLHEKQNTR